MTDRRAFIGTLAGGLLVSPFAAEAQQAAKVPRIGYLVSNLAASPHLHEAFRQGLRDLGYVEGRSVVIEYRDAGGKYDRLPALAAELVALKVEGCGAGAGHRPRVARPVSRDAQLPQQPAAARLRRGRSGGGRLRRAGGRGGRLGR